MTFWACEQTSERTKSWRLRCLVANCVNFVYNIARSSIAEKKSLFLNWNRREKKTEEIKNDSFRNDEIKTIITMMIMLFNRYSNLSMLNLNWIYIEGQRRAMCKKSEVWTIEPEKKEKIHMKKKKTRLVYVCKWKKKRIFFSMPLFAKVKALVKWLIELSEKKNECRRRRIRRRIKRKKTTCPQRRGTAKSKTVKLLTIKVYLARWVFVNSPRKKKNSKNNHNNNNKQCQEKKTTINMKTNTDLIWSDLMGNWYFDIAKHSSFFFHVCLNVHSMSKHTLFINMNNDAYA